MILWVNIAPYPSVMQFMGNLSCSSQWPKIRKKLAFIKSLIYLLAILLEELAALKTSSQCNFFMTAPEEALFFIYIIFYFQQYFF